MMNNPMQMLNEFMRFKNSFQGDPQATVQELIKSGQMSQQQLNALQQQAQQLQSFASAMGLKL